MNKKNHFYDNKNMFNPFFFNIFLNKNELKGAARELGKNIFASILIISESYQNRLWAVFSNSTAFKNWQDQMRLEPDRAICVLYIV